MAILFFEKENGNVPANVPNFCKRLKPHESQKKTV